MTREQRQDRGYAYLVDTVAGVKVRSVSFRMLCLTFKQAKEEGKRVIGVRRLHTDSRRIDLRSGGTLQYEGVEYEVLYIESYSAVPKSHPDFQRAGGVRIYKLKQLTKSPVRPFAYIAQSPPAQLANTTPHPGVGLRCGVRRDEHGHLTT